MKPFNLQEAKAGKPVCTRDGSPARIICFDRKDLYDKYPIMALILGENGTEYCQSYTINGRCAKDCTIIGSDLMMATENREGFINIYKHRSKRVVGSLFDTINEAKLSTSDSDYITTIKIEWEE